MLTREEVDIYLRKLEIAIAATHGSNCPDTKLISKVNQALKGYNPAEIKQIVYEETGFTFKIIQSPHANFVIEVLYLVCNGQLPKEYAPKALYILAVIYYNSLLNKYLRYCNDLIFDKAISKLKSTNLLKKYGKDGALRKLAIDVSKRLQCTNTTEIIKRIVELRHRIAQSLKWIVGKYLDVYRQAKTNVSVSYDRLIDKAVQNVLFYGLVKVHPTCSEYEDVFVNDLPNIDEYLFRSSLEEIFKLLGDNPTRQAILGNLHKLKYTKQLLQSLGLPVSTKSLYCYVATIYQTVRG
jgi:hypothetical protein